MSHQIDDYVKRPVQYQNIDGLGELATGFMWMGFWLLGFLLKTAHSGSFWHVYAVILVCLAALCFGLLYARKALKRRITYPRTGYVKYGQAGKRVRLIAGVLAGLALGDAIDFVLRRFASHYFEAALIAYTSAGLGLLYVLFTRMNAAWRWFVLVAMVVGPSAVAMLPIGQLWAGTFPFVLQGLIFVVSGAITLTLYLRQNPVPELGAE